MDPVTHLLSGALGARAARRWLPDQKWLMPFCLLAAWLPDADILIPVDGPEAGLIIHRGISTSFFGMIFMALALALVFKLVRRESPFPRMAALGYLLMCMHMWLDLITTYGTQILAPFTNHRFALDGAFIIDPAMTLTALGLFIWSLASKKRAVLAGTLGFCWLLAYPMANMATGTYLESRYAERLESEGIAYQSVRVTPDGLDPIFWKVVVDTGDQYILDGIDILDPDYEFLTERFQKADPALLARLGEQESMFSTYAWFSLWTTQREAATSQGTDVIFQDLRFTSATPFMRRIFDGRGAPFTLIAHLDRDGKLLGWTFNEGASSTMGQALKDR